jgi:hypothetical protein
VSLAPITKTGLRNNVLNQCTYNGFDFGPEVRTTAFRGSPVYDSAGRTVTHNTYSISVEAPFSGQNRFLVQRMIEDARRRLSKAGMPLVYRGREFGNFIINTAIVRDVAYGPKPGDLEIMPEGNGLSGKMRWSVTVSIPDCIYAQYSNAVSSFNFDVDYVISRIGTLTRSINGSLKIANNRLNPTLRYPADSADRFREEVVRRFPWESGFRRIPGRFKLSADRSEITFGIVDEEFEGEVPPVGCLEASASHSVRNQNALNLLGYQGTITAEYTLPKGANGDAAKVAFEKLVKDRLQHHRKQLDGLSKSVIPMTYEVTRPNLYGPNKTAFSFSYVFTIGKPEKLLGVAGMWRPVPDSNWERWRSSVQGVLGSRGTANITFNIGDDRIVDLCDSESTFSQGRVVRPDALARELDVLPFDLEKPKKDTSWIAYECWLEFESDSGVVSYRTLPKEKIEPQINTPQPDAITAPLSGMLNYVAPGQWTSPGSGSGFSPQLIGGYAVPASTPPQPTGNPLLANAPVGRIMADIVPQPPENKPPAVQIQRRVNPAVYVWLVGKALRAGFPVPKPQMEDINGVKPIACSRLDMGERFMHGVKGNTVVPLYWATWRLRYLLPEYIDGPLPMPKNPILNPDR